MACALASGRRLWLVTRATLLHPDDFVAWFREDGATERLRELRQSLTVIGRADWERDLVDALLAESVARIALLNVQLSELDRRLKAWEHVPRVCARIATSTGFLFGTFALRNLLVDSTDLSLESADANVQNAMLRAITLVAMGLASTAFCVAAHVQARKLSAEFMGAADRMVDHLEASADHAEDRTRLEE
jgi:hypothetical protein